MQISEIIKRPFGAKLNGKRPSANHPIQRSIHDGDQIAQCIVDAIDNAQSSIYVAASYFTDPVYLQHLQWKYVSSNPIDIKIVLNANKENYYLPFADLVSKGAEVKVMRKSSAYGQMHDKFCIVDNCKVITGSFNWSKNARTNNDENVIYTEDGNLVDEYLEKFNKLLAESDDFEPNNLNDVEDEPVVAEQKPLDETAIYENLVKELVYAQVHTYDEQKLLTLGKERARNCGGDAHNLIQELDNVYIKLLRDIKVADDKKDNIKISLQEQLESAKGHTTLKLENDISKIESQLSSKKDSIENDNRRMRTEVTLLKAEINNLRNIEKKNLVDKLTEVKSRSQETELNNLGKKPRFPYLKLILLILVSLYCFIFYSSAAYILIYSQQDAKAARLNGEIVSDPEIYSGDALNMALEKGVGTFIFISLFPLFVLAMIFAISNIKNKWVMIPSLILVFLMIDGFTAYKITEAIHEISHLKGLTDTAWDPLSIFSHSDFYLVFVFGIFGLICFKLLLGSFLNTINARDENLRYERSKMMAANQKQSAEQLQIQVSELDQLIALKETEIIFKTENIETHHAQMAKLEEEATRKIQRVTNASQQLEIRYANITQLNIIKVENENFSYSNLYLRDRITNFIRGWKDFLHEHFSSAIAVQKSREADEQVSIWKQQNFSNSKETRL